MKRCLDVVRELKQEYGRIKLADAGMWTNQNLAFTRALWDMLIYAEAMVMAGIERKESRGCHYCDDMNGRDDEHFLKTAVAQYDAGADAHTIAWEDVPTPLVEPRERSYGKTSEKKKEKAAAGS